VVLLSNEDIFTKIVIGDGRFKIQDSRFKIQDGRFKMEDSRFKKEDGRSCSWAKFVTTAVNLSDFRKHGVL